MVLTQTED